MSLDNFGDRTSLRIDSAKNGAPRNLPITDTVKKAFTDYVLEAVKAGRDDELDDHIFMSTK